MQDSLSSLSNEELTRLKLELDIVKVERENREADHSFRREVRVCESEEKFALAFFLWTLYNVLGNNIEKLLAFDGHTVLHTALSVTLAYALFRRSLSNNPQFK